ncbi:MAG: hypothetical protein LBQ93_01555 [Treponema sp.]|jgi:hypothetical protein|nr:hypothetical protein [Treponema sp.]
MKSKIQSICGRRTVGDTPVETVMGDLISIIREVFNTDELSLETGLCELLDAWMESGMKNLAELAVNIEDCLGINGYLASNIMWYLVRLEYNEGRIIPKMKK